MTPPSFRALLAQPECVVVNRLIVTDVALTVIALDGWVIPS